MKTKLLGLFGLSILSLILFMGVGSASISFINVVGDTQTANQGSTVTVSFQLQESGFGNLTNMSFNVPLTLTSGTDTLVSASSVTGAVTSLNQSVTSGTMSLTFSIPSTQVLGTYTENLTLSGTYTNNVNYDLPLSITVTAIPQTEPQEVITCNALGNPGDLRVKDIDFKNFGILHLKNTDPFYIEFGDDDEWFPLDEVEIDIEIENNGDFDVDDIEIEWGIYNTKSNELIIEFDDEKDFNLRDGKDEIITVSFQLEDDLDVDLEDLDDGKHYRFYVTARGIIDDSKSPNDGEDTCVSDFETAEIIIESDFVVLNHIDFPETVQCNAAVQITAEVWNIGDDDQDEVKVEIHNSALGLFHKMIEIGDIDSFDDDTYTFNFKVPRDAEEKTHTLEFRVFDEDFDVYENDFDDDESKFFLPFRVSGGCASTGAADVSISANLESGGRAGEELTIRATVTNNGDELNTFSVRATGFSQWASSFTVDRISLVLDAGDSVDVIFTFSVNRDASGSQSFSIELVSEDNQVITQPVSVAIEGRSGGFLGRLTGGVISGGNAYLWGIGILNIILVVIIIIVAVRIARR